MEVIVVLVLISIALVAGALGFFVWTVRSGTFEHSDRLTLLPLLDDAAATAEGRSANTGKASRPRAGAAEPSRTRSNRSEGQ